MGNELKYAIYNSIIGALIGGYFAFNSSQAGYWIFAIGGPLSGFITGYFLWKFFAKKYKELNNRKLILLGFLTGTISHYICWVILGVGMNICYWSTGNCTDSLGSPPANILVIFVYSLGLAAASLIFLGWITISTSIGLAFLVNMKNDKNEEHLSSIS